MFVEPILKRLENKIQFTVGQVSGAAIALVPLLVAVGFGTAAADSISRSALVYLWLISYFAASIWSSHWWFISLCARANDEAPNSPKPNWPGCLS